MLDQFFAAVDGFVEAVRQKSHDAVDKGCDAIETLIESIRGKLAFAGPNQAARAVECRNNLLACETDCCDEMNAAAPGTVGAGFDLSRILKVITIIKTLIDTLFPADPAPAA